MAGAVLLVAVPAHAAVTFVAAGATIETTGFDDRDQRVVVFTDGVGAYQEDEVSVDGARQSASFALDAPDEGQFGLDSTTVHFFSDADPSLAAFNSGSVFFRFSVDVRSALQLFGSTSSFYFDDRFSIGTLTLTGPDLVRAFDVGDFFEDEVLLAPGTYELLLTTTGSDGTGTTDRIVPDPDNFVLAQTQSSVLFQVTRLPLPFLNPALGA